MVLPAPIFGVDFSPFKPNLVSAASQDGLVRIFDYYTKDPLVCVLRGHSSRIFHVKWSPLDANMIASGSDDRQVIVWRVPVEYMGTHYEDGKTVANTPGSHLTDATSPKKELEKAAAQVSAVEIKKVKEDAESHLGPIKEVVISVPTFSTRHVA